MTADRDRRPQPFALETDRARASSAMATHASWTVALEQVTGQVIGTEPAPPDVVVLFASPSYGDAFDRLLHVARERTRTGILLGCSASGFLASVQESEDQPGLAMMALWLPGAKLLPIRLHQEHLDLLDDPAVWNELYGGTARDINSWLVFAEPYRVDAQALIQCLARLYPGACIAGGIASGMIEGRRSCVFLDGHWYDDGAVALGFGGQYRLAAHVSQGCEPIGETWTITEVDRNIVTGISNRPALEVLEQTLAILPDSMRERARTNLVVGLAADEYRDAFARGDFMVRGMLGIDQERNAIVLGGIPRVGQTIQFHVRDATSASVDMTTMLDRALSDDAPVAAILCTCDGRGQTLFGVPHHDAAATSAALGSAPLVGAFCLGEIGPLGDQTVLHGFTATLGLISRVPDRA